MSASLVYKFVELTIVTDETIEAAVNEWVGKGWQLEAIRFAMSDASMRPAMAFVSFVRSAGPKLVSDQNSDDTPL
jgi:hypothetical protein